jgi:hypothetical protein
MVPRCCAPAICAAANPCSIPPSSCTGASSSGTCWYCTVMADSVGVLWRAASGTVDPWTKGNLVSSSNKDLVRAHGVNPCTGQPIGNVAFAVAPCGQIQLQNGSVYDPSDGTLYKPDGSVCGKLSGTQADIITNVLKSEKADPSQFWCGLKDSLNKANSMISIVIAVGVAIMAMAIYEDFFKRR